MFVSLFHPFAAHDRSYRAPGARSGLFGAARPRPAPSISCRKPPPRSLRAPRGKTLALFPAPPFAAFARKISAYIVFTFKRPAFSGRRIAYGNRFTRGLNARVHSAFFPRAATPARGKPRSPPARSAATASQQPFAISNRKRLFLPVTRTCACPGANPAGSRAPTSLLSDRSDGSDPSDKSDGGGGYARQSRVCSASPNPACTAGPAFHTADCALPRPTTDNRRP